MSMKTIQTQFNLSKLQKFYIWYAQNIYMYITYYMYIYRNDNCKTWKHVGTNAVNVYMPPILIFIQTHHYGQN